VITLSSITIGPITAHPGEKKSGELLVARRSFSQVCSPITVIRGKKSGPVLAVLAGEHGCEYCGIAAAVKLCREIKPEQISGTLIIVPVVNILSFEARSLFVTPLDMINIYTTYPGDSDGSITHSMAKTVFEEVVLRANYVVHLHGGDANEALVPFTYFAVTGNKKVDEVSEAMARSFPVDYVFPMTEAKVGESLQAAPKGTTYTTSVEGTIYREASIRGIPGTMSEIGREGKIEQELVDKQYTGILNVMKYLGMLEGKPERRASAKKLRNAVLVSARKGGLFQPFVEIGGNVKKGQVIGEIVALTGEVAETIKSPIDGVLICRMNYAATDPNPLPSQPYLFYITEVE
jgi:predicted deacylase